MLFWAKKSRDLFLSQRRHPGCTTEDYAFRDQFEVFEDADAMIIGISAQSVESHLNFAKKYSGNIGSAKVRRVAVSIITQLLTC